MPIIKLQSADEEIFETDVQIVKCSGTIKKMFEDCDMEEGANSSIPLTTVSSAILRKVLAWASYHKDDLQLIDDDEVQSDEISQWDADFLNVDQATLFELVMAAHDLDIKVLLDLTTKYVANMIRGKTPQEIRQTFKIKDDLTRKSVGDLRGEQRRMSK